MDEKLAKLMEYLQMETEIPFEEFKSYYSGMVELLNKEYDGMDQTTLLKGKYICTIVKANAESRAPRSKINGKHFKKMAAKLGFWADAIEFRLKKEGMTQDEIDGAISEFNKLSEQ